MRDKGAFDDGGSGGWIVDAADALAGEKDKRLWALKVVGVWKRLGSEFELKELIVAAGKRAEMLASDMW